MPVLRTIILCSYFLALGMLALYGLHRIYLVFLLRRRRATAFGRPDSGLGPSSDGSPRGARDGESIAPDSTARLSSAEDDAGSWPVVTVQLPIYNELDVAPRLLEAVCAFDYPRDRVEIQVLDDSTDATSGALALLAARLAAAGHEIRIIRRSNRNGFKAGALAGGLARARGELVAVFDADFVPGPGFLRAVVTHFTDPQVGMVQARWGHLNRGYSLLTRVQALLLDGHFLIEHAAGQASGCFLNFNGTAGVWRRRCIEESGGWQGDTLTEDLDLSYRAQLAGWRFVFLPGIIAPAELPVDMSAFKGQQHRWAKGSIQTARKLLPRILAAPLPLRVRAEAFVHLTANVSHPLMVALAVLFFPAALLRSGGRGSALLAVDLAVLLCSTLAFWLFYAAAEVAQGGRVGRALSTMPALMTLGIGLSVNGARAVLEGFFGGVGSFERTPKRGVVDLSTSRPGPWAASSLDSRTALEPEPGAAPPPLLGSSGPARAAHRIALPWVEGALAVYLTICVVLALRSTHWSFLPFLVLFWAGYTHMMAASLLEVRRSRLSRRRATAGRVGCRLATP